ncbi:hypothetical protein TNIN_210411 [Trichonephila inaurata madagascariensis]|uniref:Uncharacterized protein n=1 Tax=Trichonephila inaurata madagascariensis TaxID=2747483 RepID=A0A8X6YPX3_9ARAC|nr:hypothetical protein TNIN_210411 [Trichonephila inaurata madagascariensis]
MYGPKKFPEDRHTHTSFFRNLDKDIQHFIQTWPGGFDGRGQRRPCHREVEMARPICLPIHDTQSPNLKSVSTSCRNWWTLKIRGISSISFFSPPFRGG